MPWLMAFGSFFLAKGWANRASIQCLEPNPGNEVSWIPKILGEVLITYNI